MMGSTSVSHIVAATSIKPPYFFPSSTSRRTSDGLLPMTSRHSLSDSLARSLGLSPQDHSSSRILLIFSTFWTKVCLATRTFSSPRRWARSTELSSVRERVAPEACQQHFPSGVMLTMSPNISSVGLSAVVDSPREASLATFVSSASWSFTSFISAKSLVMSFCSTGCFNRAITRWTTFMFVGVCPIASGARIEESAFTSSASIASFFAPSMACSTSSSRITPVKRERSFIIARLRTFRRGF